MNEHVIILPILWQFIIALTLMFLWRHVLAQKIVSIAGSVFGLLIAGYFFYTIWAEGIITMQSGDWSAPFGITLVADTLSATMVLLTAIVGLAVAAFSSGSILDARVKFGFFPILHFLFIGLYGAFLTGDIFNLYVWFEIIIISSFVLLTIGGMKAQIEGAVKYYTLNILASTLFLTAIALLYGLTGSLNMADLSLKIAAVENRTLVNITAVVFFVGFGIKSAVFPLYFWLPASYHTPPPAVAAVFGGLLTKVGVYAMFRVFTLLFPLDPFLQNVITGVAVLTIFSGALGALVQNNVNKIFSFLIICHIGFMVGGLGMASELALTGAVFYMIHDIIVKANLFMLGGILHRMKGTNNIKKMGGLYADYPKLSLLLLIPLFSLIGIPPLSGFWPKLSLISGGLATSNYLLIGWIIFGSFITLVVIARLWSEVFWKEKEEAERKPYFKYFSHLSMTEKSLMLLPIGLLAMVSLYIGFGAGQMQVLAERIAFELQNPQLYIEKVLGNQLK